MTTLVRTAALILLVTAASSVPAQTLPPGISYVQSFVGTSLGLTPPIGGLEFDATGSLLYMSMLGNASTGAIYAFGVQRHPITNQVTGLGVGTPITTAPMNDAGLQFGHAGTLFWTTTTNNLGQYTVGSFNFETSLSSSGMSGGTGGLEFVPLGYPNTGELLVSSFTGGDIYSIPLSPNGNGTFTPVSGGATLFASLPPGSDGMRHIPSGTHAGDMLVCNWMTGEITKLSLDPVTGLAVPGSEVPFITNLTWAAGIAFDPVTSDLFVSDYGAGNIHQFTGFGAPFPGCGAGTVGVGAGGPIDILLVNGSNGGFSRRVTMPILTPFAIDVVPPPTSPGPAPFVIFGMIGTPTSADVFPLPFGAMCFTPSIFTPAPAGFVLVDNFFLGGPPLLPATPTPWSFTVATGMPFAIEMTLQGVIIENVTTLSITNVIQIVVQ
jgi:hypothetical protein